MLYRWFGLVNKRAWLVGQAVAKQCSWGTAVSRTKNIRMQLADGWGKSPTQFADIFLL